MLHSIEPIRWKERCRLGDARRTLHAAKSSHVGMPRTLSIESLVLVTLRKGLLLEAKVVARVFGTGVSGFHNGG